MVGLADQLVDGQQAVGRAGGSEEPVVELAVAELAPGSDLAPVGRVGVPAVGRAQVVDPLEAGAGVGVRQERDESSRRCAESAAARLVVSSCEPVMGSVRRWTGVVMAAQTSCAAAWVGAAANGSSVTAAPAATRAARAFPRVLLVMAVTLETPPD